MFEQLVVRLLKKIVVRLPHRTITAPDGSPYLTRWYLWPGKPRTDGEKKTSKAPFALFIHFFHRGDKDRHRHNHPWKKSLALILAYGYREEREYGERVFKPGSVNVINHDDYHRVELLYPDKGSWSLFVAGEHTGDDWGFFDDEAGEHIPHGEYLERKFS